MEQILNHIDGAWLPATGGAWDDNIDPATGEAFAQVARSGAADVDAAARAAARAFAAWRRLPAPRRGEILLRVAEVVRERKDDLARLMTREMGKVLEEARGDVQEAIDMAHYMAGEGRRLFGHTVPTELPDKFAMAVREPIGVVAAITPWNFPVAVPSWKILPALVCGNTVVWKPSPESPATAAAFVRCFIDAGLPAGVLNLVVGGGADVGAALVEHPVVRLVSFTGSTATGRQVAEAAGRLLKRCTLELGGKNAITVLADANLDLAADAVVWAAFGTSGQRCTACSRVIAEAPVYDALIERIVARAQTLRLGSGLDPAVQVGPVINAAALGKIADYIGIGRAEGAQVLCGGTPVDRGRGFYFAPTVLGGVRPEMRVAREEIFGPVVSCIQVANLEEAVAVNNAVEYGLSASIFTGSVQSAFRAMRELDTGIVYVNHGTTGAEIQLPFGGTKATGNGHREAGQAAIDTFTEWKSIYVDYSGRLQRAQIDTDKIIGN